MSGKLMALGAWAFLVGVGAGCGGNDGDPVDDRAKESNIVKVCQRLNDCDLLDEGGTSDCVVSGTEVLDGFTQAQRDALDRSFADCLESSQACGLFEDCVEGAFEDVINGPDGTDPPDDCSATGAACVQNSDCCASYLCVDFGDSTTCARTCTGDSQCSSCCATLEGGGGACGPASFCDPPTSDPCGECISSCSGLGIPGCCTGLGCICQDECAVSGCTPPAEFCCGPYDCICTANCPY